MSSPPVRIAFHLALTLLLVQGVGCIGVQSNPSREFTSFPPAEIAGEETYDVRVNVNTNVSGVASANSVRANLSGDVLNAYVTRLNQTGRIEAPGQNPYVANMMVIDEGSGGGALVASVLTGLTLYVIPSWSTHSYTTSLKLTDPAGNEFATKTYQHQLTLVQQLFMVFGMPFSGLQRRYDEMWGEVMADAAVWTVEKLDARR
jgi:hypothetical protein